MFEDISPLDLEDVEEVIMVVADDEEDSPSEAEAEGEQPALQVKSCVCDTCEGKDLEDLGICWNCDDTECDGGCA